MSYRQLPTLRQIGFEMQTPSEVDVQPANGEVAVRCLERRPDGKTIGELEVTIFKAALVIDRDGILEEKAREAIDGAAERGAYVQPAVPVSLPGASGFRAGVELVRPMGSAPPALPFVHVFAMAPHDLGVDGGVIVTVRCASPDWPAAEQILRSLRILTRHGGSANDADETPPLLPIVDRRDD